NAADASQWYSSRRVAERVSGYKILIGEGTDATLRHMLFSSRFMLSGQIWICVSKAARHGSDSARLPETFRVLAVPSRVRRSRQCRDKCTDLAQNISLVLEKDIMARLRKANHPGLGHALLKRIRLPLPVIRRPREGVN